MNRPWLLITGGAQRIGAAINTYFVQQGYNVIIHYHQSELAALNLKATLKKLGADVMLWQADLSQPEQAQISFEQLLTHIPQLDVLINSASTFEKNTLLNSQFQEIEHNFHLHVTSAWLLTQSLMKTHQKANIINMLDANSVHNSIEKVPYLLAKKSLADFTELAAIACAPAMRVNGLALGYVLDAIDNTEQAIDSAEINVLQRQVPLDDIYLAIKFLIENRSITGQIINLDGGSHLKCPSYMLKN